MPLEPASDRAFRIFAAAYGRAWAPQPKPERASLHQIEASLVREEPQRIVPTMITTTKAGGGLPS